ncbi:MAG: hypothetical protein GC162_05820 [Planctomycetes bacterium]|nr:hypothetical protein [Planctomycetota bacterium]
MFPQIQQRVAIAVALVAGTLIYAGAQPAAQAADGSAGLTLLYAASPTTAVATMAMMGLCVVILAGLAGATGSPLAGPFVIGAALVLPAAHAGSIDEWLRNVESSAAYWSLAGESIVWAVLMFAGVWICQSIAGAVGPMLPAWMKSTPGKAADVERSAATMHDPAAQDGGSSELGLWTVVEQVSERTKLSKETAQWLLATISAAVIGGVLCWVLVPTTAVWQCIWGIGFAWIFAGVGAHQMFPTARVSGILISPMIAAFVWYIWAAVSGGSSTQMLSAYFSGDFVNAAKALPSFYASAGVAGAAIGIGWSQVLIRTHAEEQAAMDEADAAAA